MNRHKAAALGYNVSDYAPKVLARGRGEAADVLCRIARNSGVPIVKSDELADSLSSLKPFAEVPELYWRALAEILRFVYETRGQNELHQG